MTTVDLLLGLYLGVQVIAGWRRGFAAAFLGLVSMIVSMAGAYYLCQPAAVLLDRYTGVFRRVSTYFQQVLAPATEQAEAFELILRGIGLATASGSGLTAGIRTTADALGRLVVSAGCFLVLIMVLGTVLGIVANAICSPLKEGPVAVVNGLLGGAFGFGLGIIHVAIVFIAVAPLVKLGLIEAGWIESSVLLRFVGDLAARIILLVTGRGT